MATINIAHPHHGDIASVKKTVDELTKKLSSTYGLDCEWEGDAVKFERTGVKGEVRIEANQVAITVELGMLFGAMAPKIEGDLKKMLAEKLG